MKEDWKGWVNHKIKFRYIVLTWLYPIVTIITERDDGNVKISNED